MSIELETISGILAEAGFPFEPWSASRALDTTRGSSLIVVGKTVFITVYGPDPVIDRLGLMKKFEALGYGVEFAHERDQFYIFIKRNTELTEHELNEAYGV